MITIVKRESGWAIVDRDGCTIKSGFRSRDVAATWAKVKGYKITS